MKRFLIASVLTLGLVFVGGGGSWAYAQELPSAESILDREEEAVGGKEVNQKVKSVIMKGTLAIQDVKIQLSVFHAGAKLSYKELAFEGVGDEALVVNGDVVWKKHSITGSQLLSGADRAKALNDAAGLDDLFQRVGQWRKRFKQVKTVGEETIEGKPAYKVALTTMEGETWTDHYDKESGLLVRREMPQGNGTMVQVNSDFRKIDGIVHAFKTRMSDGRAELVLTIESIEHNVNIPAQRFAIPGEIQKQLNHANGDR